MNLRLKYGVSLETGIFGDFVMLSLASSDESASTWRTKAMDWRVCAENDENEFLVKAWWGVEEVWMGCDEACRIPENDINRLAAMRREWASRASEECLEAILKENCAFSVYNSGREDGKDGDGEVWDEEEEGMEWEDRELKEVILRNVKMGFDELEEGRVDWVWDGKGNENEKWGVGREGAREGASRAVGGAMETEGMKEDMKEEVCEYVGRWVGEAVFRLVCGIGAHATDEAMLQWAGRMELCVKVK